MNKKGLAIVYDPHNLHQFIWYYCTYGKDKEWDALCLPNGYKGTYMDSYCEKSGIFSKVLTGHVDYLKINILTQILIFIKMLFYFIIGKRKKFCKKFLNQYVGNIDEYDEICSICDSGMVSGICALLGTEKKISYFDDGGGDYEARTKWQSGYKITSWTYWQGFILSRMGYCCKGRFYFEPTKYCYKYSARTDKMLYINYKEMLELYDFTNTDKVLFDSIIEKIYPEIKNVDFESVDSVLFTDPFFDPNVPVLSSEADAKYFIDKFVKHIEEKSKSLILKRHPRDNAEYNFAPSVKIQEIKNEIPAEVILPYLKGKNIYFLLPTSIMIFMQPYGYLCNILYSDEMAQKRRSDKKAMTFMQTKDDYIQYSERFAAGKYNIIDI